MAALRNNLAHGAGVSKVLALRLLSQHAPEFESCFEKHSWLREIILVAPNLTGGPRYLIGTSPKFSISDNIDLSHIKDGYEELVVLSRKTNLLKLWPFIIYGKPIDVETDKILSDAEEVLQVYYRKALRLLLTPLVSCYD